MLLLVGGEETHEAALAKLWYASIWLSIVGQTLASAAVYKTTAGTRSHRPLVCQADDVTGTLTCSVALDGGTPPLTIFQVFSTSPDTGNGRYLMFGSGKVTPHEGAYFPVATMSAETGLGDSC